MGFSGAKSKRVWLSARFLAAMPAVHALCHAGHFLKREKC
jgi:hypothetical protein